MTQLTPPTPFANALDLKCEHNGEYTTIFSSSFVYGTKAHGGLLVSLVQRAVAMHFESSPDKPGLTDVFELKMHFFRPTIAREIGIHLQDVFVAKRTATIMVKVFQGGELKVTGLVTMGNFNYLQPLSFDTDWSLTPRPAEASIPQLASDSDPRWISVQIPWHPQGYARPQSYVKFYVPFEIHHPSIGDSWLTPSDASFAFKTEHLGFLGDMVLPIPDNFCGYSGERSHAACIAAGLEQKMKREKGIVEMADANFGLSTPPMGTATLSLNMGIKKRLPPEGVRWLFSRNRARRIRDGRMDSEIVILDEHGELVALVQQVYQLIDHRSPQDIKMKI